MSNRTAAPPDESARDAHAGRDAHAARDTVRALHARDLAAQALGVEILEVAPGAVRLAMLVRTDMLNGHGTCHGGMLFSLADTAFAFACNSHGEAMVAAGASIEFIASAARGDRLIASASETSRSARHGIYDVAVTKASGELVAHFRGRCARLRVPSATSA